MATVLQNCGHFRVGACAARARKKAPKDRPPFNQLSPKNPTSVLRVMKSGNAAGNTAKSSGWFEFAKDPSNSRFHPLHHLFSLELMNSKISVRERIQTTTSSQSTGAFSLVELLVAVAVLAIIVTVAIPSISVTVQGAQRARDLRNAQMLSSLSVAAVSAGFPGRTNMEEWVELLRNGFTVTNNLGAQIAYFKVTYLSDSDVSKATNFLFISNNLLLLNE